MTNEQIETLIREAEKKASSDSFLGARVVGLVSLLLTPMVFIAGVGIVVGVVAGVGWICTLSLWADGKAAKSDLAFKRARLIWEEIGGTGIFGQFQLVKTRDLVKEIAGIYERDPQGEVLPLSQAVRLVLVWQQQQERLQVVRAHVKQMSVLRDTLLEKQKLLRELNDDNPQLEKTLVRLNADLSPLERSSDALRASCVRLESIVATVDAAARRRQLHREVGQLAAQLEPRSSGDNSLQVADEHLDLERQIGREIETFLQLERETDAHLRDL